MRYLILFLGIFLFALETSAVLKDIPEMSELHLNTFRTTVSQNRTILTDLAKEKITEVVSGGWKFSRTNLKAAQMGLFMSFAQPQDLASLETKWRMIYPSFAGSEEQKINKMFLFRAFSVSRLSFFLGFKGYKPSSLETPAWRNSLLSALDTHILEAQFESTNEGELNLWRAYQRSALVYKILILADFGDHGLHTADENPEKLQSAYTALDHARRMSRSKNLDLYELSLLVEKGFVPEGRSMEWCKERVRALKEDYERQVPSEKGNSLFQRPSLHGEDESLAVSAVPGRKTDIHTPPGVFIQNLKKRAFEKYEAYLAQTEDAGASGPPQFSHGEGDGSFSPDVWEGSPPKDSQERDDAAPSENADEATDFHDTLEEDPGKKERVLVVPQMSSFQESPPLSPKDDSSEEESAPENVMKGFSPRLPHEEKDDLFPDIPDERVSNPLDFSVAAAAEAGAEEEQEEMPPMNVDTEDGKERKRSLSDGRTSERKRLLVRHDSSEENSDQEDPAPGSEDEMEAKEEDAKKSQNASRINSYIHKNPNIVETLFALKDSLSKEALVKRFEDLSGLKFYDPETGLARVQKLLAKKSLTRKKVGAFALYLKENHLLLRSKVSAWQSSIKKSSPKILPRELAKQLAFETVEFGNLQIEITAVEVTNMEHFIVKCGKPLTIQEVLNSDLQRLKVRLQDFQGKWKRKGKKFAETLQENLEAFAREIHPSAPRFVSTKAARHFMAQAFDTLNASNESGEALLSFPQSYEFSEMSLYLQAPKNIDTVRKTLLELAPRLKISRGKDEAFLFEEIISKLAGKDLKFNESQFSTTHRMLKKLYARHIIENEDGTFELKPEESH